MKNKQKKQGTILVPAIVLLLTALVGILVWVLL